MRNIEQKMQIRIRKPTRNVSEICKAPSLPLKEYLTSTAQKCFQGSNFAQQKRFYQQSPHLIIPKKGADTQIARGQVLNYKLLPSVVDLSVFKEKEAKSTMDQGPRCLFAGCPLLWGDGVRRLLIFAPRRSARVVIPVSP